MTLLGRFIPHSVFTLKGGYRRAEKSRAVLMMIMMVAKLGWAGAIENSESLSALLSSSSRW